MALSIVRNEDRSYTALLRMCDRNERLEIPEDRVRASFLRNLLGMGPSNSNYIRAVRATLPAAEFRRVTKPELPASLLEFEEKQTIKGFKFGLLYCAPDQVREDEMFANGGFA